MKRSKSGFSMTELLTVVAILAVLIAVAVPAVIAASKTLKMRELDDTAREIFLAAQNTLTARKADGTLSAPEGDQVEGQEGWYWLFDGDTDFLLPDGAVEPAVAENHIAIWYNAASAMVLEVYYGEKNGSFASPGCDEWNVGAIQNGAYSNSRSRSESAGEARAEKRIGYYDGTDLPRGAVEQLLPPVLEIVNSDELKVIVTVPKQHKKNDLAAPLIPSELTVLVEGTGEGGQKVLLSFDQTGCTDISSGDSRKYELVLDSLTEESLQFKKVCPTISPGANIRVTAKLSAEDEKDEEGKVITRYLSASAREDTNSLFADRDENNIVSVACARHLQNLEDGFSGFACASAVNVKQTSRIDWPADKCDFFSIENDCIKAYDGGKLEIRGLDAGLFNSTSENMQMEHIRIVNPIIEGSGNVGALVNTAQNARIDDCWIYATTIKPEKTEPQTEDFNALKTDFIVKGGTVGGLVGSATGCTITNSFAALSKVEGNTVGGLIGSASWCSITNCYATAENLSGSTSAMFIGSMTGGNVTGCYAAGNIASSGGTVSGFANGSGTFSGSYCAVSYNKEDGTPTGLTPQYGFAAGSIDSCAYLTVNAPANADSAASKNYEELKAWVNDWQTLSAAQTHPYRAELDGEAYPFPGLDIMPHYGSWPVQTVKGIKLYDSPSGEDEIQIILVPRGGKKTVWAQVDDGSIQATVGEPPNGSILSKKDGISSQIDSDNPKRTKITVDSGKKQRPKTGVTYVDITAGGYTLRAVIVVYDASLTLSGQAASGSSVKNSAASDAPQSVQRLLSLEADNYAVFHADLQIEPTVDTVNNDLNSIRAKDGNIVLSVPDGYRVPDTMWRGFQVVRGGTAQQTGGPGVAVNPAVDAENRIYILADKAGTNAQYPYASGTPVMGADGKSVTSAGLEVIGQSAGTAQIAVSWAMDDSLTVVCPVNVSGAQVAIKTASAQEDGGRDLGSSKKNYPYLLHIKPAPKKSFTLKFESQLFGNPPAGATEISYAWTVSKSSGTVIGTGTGAETSILIEDQEAQADYRVKLVYSYKTAGKLYATSDFMHVTVTRVTEKRVSGGNDIVVTLPDGAASIVLEQIDWGEEVEAPASWPAGKKLTEATVYGQVDGSADTQLEWLLQADTYNADEKRITGQEGSVEVKGPEDKVIAVLNWTPEEVVGKSRGGQVRVTALDSSYYGSDAYPNGLRFSLIARAKDNSLTPDEKEVVVTIMPKLQITPQSKATQVGTEVEYSANRTNTADWTLNWTAVNSNTTVTGSNSTITLSLSDDGTYDISLQYGPYIATATLNQISNWGKIMGVINWSGRYENTNHYYYLLEKNTEQNLEMAFFSATFFKSKIVQESFSPSTGVADFGTPLGGSVGLNTAVYEGSRLWKVKGVDYGKVEMTWKYQHQYISWLNAPYTYDLYVVGADFSAQSISVGKGNDASATLTLSSYFPSAVEADGGTVTLRTSAEDIISVSGEGVTASTDAGGQTVYSYTAKDRVDKALTITGERYGSVVLTASYAVNGKTYTDSCVVRVEPEAGTLSVRLETCGKDDLSSIKELFGLDSLPAYAATYADYDGSREPTLLTDAVFGHDTLYLKAYVVDGEGGVVSADPNVFASSFASGNSYVASCESRIGRMTDGDGNEAYCYLLEIKGKNGMKDGEAVEITASFGTLKQTKAIHVYSQPSVVFEPEVMTNDHTVIRGSEFATGQKKNFKAHLEPLLLDEDGKTLDSLKWYLEYPEAENDAGFLVLSQTEDGGSAEVEMLANPWLKVAVTAQSRTAYEAALTETDADQKWKLESTSVAAHALVFLPDEGTGSGSMTRRKRYNVLGA